MSQITAVPTGTSIGAVMTLTGNSGGAVSPTAGNINTVGSGNITVVGNPGTSTLTASITGVIPIANGGTNASSFATTDGTVYYDGTRLVTTATGTSGQLLTSNGAGMAPTYQTAAASSITITGDSGGGLTGSSFTFTGGTTGLTMAGSGSTETLGGTLAVKNGGTGAVTLTGVLTGNGTSAVTANAVTQHGVVIGGASNAVSSTAVGANGFVLLGATAADPAFAALTSTGGTITFTTGANSLNLEATGTSVFNYTLVNTSPYTVLSTDDYLGVDSSGGAITVKLPNGPATGRVFYVKDSTGSAAAHNITITTVGGAVNIDGATSFVMNTNYESASVIFNGTSYEIF